MQGIYEIRFRGATDWGMGLLIFRAGEITGADVAGVEYDGTYTETETTINAVIVMTVPPGVTLVQGTPIQSRPYDVSFNANIDKTAFTNGTPVFIDLPPGPVNVVFRRLKAI